MRKRGLRQRRSLKGPLAGAATCLLAMAANGCSFIFSAGPPPDHRQMRYFDCPSSHVPPVIDTVLAAAGGLVTLAAVALTENPINFSEIRRPNAHEVAPAFAQIDGSEAAGLVAIAAALVAVPTVSAIRGYAKVSECREAKAELVARINAAPTVGPPPGPYEPPQLPRQPEPRGPAATTPARSSSLLE